MNDALVDYICVTDRSRAESFYRKVFPRAAVLVKGASTFFDVDGHIFGLRDASQAPGESRRGNHRAPQLRVEVTDVRAEAIRLVSLSVGIVKPVEDLAHFRTVHIRDTEGNTIELYQTLLAVD